MKELGDNGSTTTRGLPPGAHISSDKLIRDQELQHLVTSSIPSPPYGGLSLINASAALTVFGADPIYSTHLLASLAANNPNAHFQLPIPIPMALQPTANHHPLHHHHHQRNLFHHLTPTAVPAFAGIPGAMLPNAAQLDILSSWVNEQASKDDRKITSTTHTTPVNNKHNGSNKNKRNNNVVSKNNKNLTSNNITKSTKVTNGSNNLSVTKTNRKNKAGRNHNGNVSSENEMKIKSEKFEKNSDHMITEAIIQPFLLPLEKSPMGIKEGSSNELDLGSPMKSTKLNLTFNHQGDNSASPPAPNNNNYNGKNKGQTSPGSNNPRDKVFTCPTCNRCFGYKHVLQNHERTHTGEKPFECNICMKKFTRDHHLKTHMRLHTGEKPYQCTHCDRQFVQVANLRRHLRVHTGERPYACDLCSSRFSDSNQLKAHMLIHKGEKPYTCTGCGGQFRRRHHLAHHKCVEDSTKGPMFHPPSSPDTSPPQLTPGNGGDASFGSRGSKRERKCRETRRLIRRSAESSTTSKPLTFLSGTMPEQTQPEDLSMGGNGLRSRHYSGSSSSVTASSPSPRSGISHGSLMSRPYCNSSSETPDLYSDEDRAADSSTNGKNESSSCDDISSPSHE